MLKGRIATFSPLVTNVSLRNTKGYVEGLQLISSIEGRFKLVDQ